jgi:hypothetical protein
MRCPREPEIRPNSLGLTQVLNYRDTVAEPKRARSTGANTGLCKQLKDGQPGEVKDQHSGMMHLTQAVKTPGAIVNCQARTRPLNPSLHRTVTGIKSSQSKIQGTGERGRSLFPRRRSSQRCNGGFNPILNLIRNEAIPQ